MKYLFILILTLIWSAATIAKNDLRPVDFKFAWYYYTKGVMVPSPDFLKKD